MARTTYKSYHSNLKLSYSLGIESQLYSEETRKTIPKSTVHHWKKKSVNFYGNEYEDLAVCTLNDLKIIADRRLKQQRQLFVSFCRLYLTIIGLLDKNKLQNLLNLNRKTIIPLIENCITYYENKSFILKLLNLSSKQYARWKTLEKYRCRNSLIWLCYKRLPRQVSQNEIVIMKKLMNKSSLSHWASSSVWAYGVRNKMIGMCRSTWYHYCQLLDLNRTRKIYKKVRKRISVRAEYPNQIWHMDVSIYKSIDGIKYYIYSIIDNYSRKIINYDFSNTLSAEQRLNSLRKAINQVVQNKKNSELISDIDLIVDGGSENNNHKVSDFIKNCEVEVHKKIALKDVTYSNSMIESSFRMLKRFYLKPGISSIDFSKELYKAIEDINCKRPHYAHLIYTPDEIYQNPELKTKYPDLKAIKAKRISNNLTYKCNEECL